MVEVIEVSTGRRIELVNVTDKINDAISGSKVKEGICFIHVPHTTAAVTINEYADPNVAYDILRKTSEIIPEKDNYTHSEGNSDAHLKSSVFGPAATLIIHEGKLLLGTWQAVFFCEFDGPRDRSIYLKIIEG